MEKRYLFIKGDCCDCCGWVSNEIEIFETLDEAKKAYKLSIDENINNEDKNSIFDLETQKEIIPYE